MLCGSPELHKLSKLGFWRASEREETARNLSYLAGMLGGCILQAMFVNAKATREPLQLYRHDGVRGQSYNHLIDSSATCNGCLRKWFTRAMYGDSVPRRALQTWHMHSRIYLKLTSQAGPLRWSRRLDYSRHSRAAANPRELRPSIRTSLGFIWSVVLLMWWHHLFPHWWHWICWSACANTRWEHIWFDASKKMTRVLIFPILCITRRHARTISWGWSLTSLSLI